MSDNLEKFITPGQIFDLPKEKNHPFANERTERTEQSVPTSPTTKANRLNVVHQSSARHLWRSINKPISQHQR